MRKLIAAVTMLVSLAGSVTLAAGSLLPALHFSDITSGPAAGGKDNLGAIVTIVGKNFGAVGNYSYVTVGGVKAAGYIFWSDTKISFQIGNKALSGDIKVTTGGGTSNGLRFTVRGGTIYFVDDNGPGNPGSGTFADPWRSPSSFLRVMRPGDIVYFRGGSYGSVVLAGGQPNGTALNEIAFVGYPGEVAQVSGGPNFDIGGKAYFTIAGFRLYSQGKNISVTGDHIRIVNNDMEGLKTHSYGMIHPIYGNDIKIYGNTFTGATSGNKLDHPIYVGYGSDNVDIGWNRIYNNKIDRGPVISINTDGAQQSGYKFENIRIHDNAIDCSGARGIAIVCTQAGSSVYIYNNIFTGNSPMQTVYMYSASLYLYNNVFYGSPGAATIQLTPMNDGAYTYRPEIVEIKNNIIYNRNGGRYLDIAYENEMGKVTVENNAYYGAGNGPSRDSKAVNASPLFVDPDHGNFLLQSISPCINRGADTSSLVAFDKDGYARLQEGAVDIGAYEQGVAQRISVSNGDVAEDSVPSDPEHPGAAPFEPSPSINNILVLGSALGRGTIDPDKGETARIYFRGRETGTYHAKIFTLAGDLAWEKALQNVSEGVFEWVPREMASAVYLVHVQGPGMNVTKKLAIVK